MAGSRAPGSLRDANWAGSGDLALREMPTKMHLFSCFPSLSSPLFMGCLLPAGACAGHTPHLTSSLLPGSACPWAGPPCRPLSGAVNPADAGSCPPLGQPHADSNWGPCLCLVLSGPQSCGLPTWGPTALGWV